MFMFTCRVTLNLSILFTKWNWTLTLAYSRCCCWWLTHRPTVNFHKTVSLRYYIVERITLGKWRSFCQLCRQGFYKERKTKEKVKYIQKLVLSQLVISFFVFWIANKKWKKLFDFRACLTFSSFQNGKKKSNQTKMSIHHRIDRWSLTLQ